MKTYIYKILIVVVFMLGVQDNTYAYITLGSTSYSLNVGSDKYLSAPNAYDGYIDHAVWACSKSEISFKSKDAAGAIIQITRAYSGTAIVELLATEKYLDSYGRTRARTYYKQFLITCIGGGSSIQDSKIILPETISLKVGECKRYNILSADCYNGAFSLNWKKRNPENFAMFEVNFNSGIIDFFGVMPGEGVLNVKTVDGCEKDCQIKVASPDIISNRRTEKLATTDIKSLIANVLPIVRISGVENIIIDNDGVNRDIITSEHIYNVQGILIKRNATQQDIDNLSPGMYIIKGKKVIVR